MSKFIQRIGTSSTKFAVEIHLTKVEIKLVQKCSVMVTFKRGEHVKETKTPAPLNNGVALFDEKLSFPATLYYEKKKDGYLPKEAVLELSIITPTTKRLAGITKFDIAHYANLGMQEQDVEIKVGKCFDKDAKFHFRLHMIQLSDVSPLKKETPFSRKQLHQTNMTDSSGLSTRKSRINTQPQTMNVLPDISVDSKQFDGYASVQDATMYDQSKLHPMQHNRRTRSPGSKNNISAHEQFVQNRRSKTVDINKDSDDSIELEQHDVISQTHHSPQYSQHEIIMMTPNLEAQVAKLEDQVKHYEVQNKQLEDRASHSNQQYLNLVQEFQQMKDKYEQAKQEWAQSSPHGKQPTETFSTQSGPNEKELEERIHELSEKVHQLVAANQELEEKNHELRSQLEENHRRFESIRGPSTEDYEQRIRELQERLEASESQGRNYESQLQEMQRNLQQAESKAEQSEAHAKEIESRLHDAEHKMTESQIGHSRDLKSKDRHIEDVEISMKRLQASNDEKTQKIEELEPLIRSYESEIEALKKVNMTNLSNEEEARQLKGQLEALEHRNKAGDESHKKRIDELNKQNGEMKREIEQLKSAVNAKEIEKENVITHVGLENEKLKRQVKELNAKILTMQYGGNELEHLRENVQELKSRNDSLEAELSKLKMGWASVEVEKENMELALKESEDNNRIRQDRLDRMEMELFKLKTRFGELVNAAMEIGDDELLDKLENIIAGEELESIRQHSRKSEV